MALKRRHPEVSEFLLQILFQEPGETYRRFCQLLLYDFDGLLVVAWLDFVDLRLTTALIGLAVVPLKNKVKLYGRVIDDPRVDRCNGETGTLLRPIPNATLDPLYHEGRRNDHH